MYCKNCGAEIPDGAMFCGNCGMKIETENMYTFSTLLNYLHPFSLPFLQL